MRRSNIKGGLFFLLLGMHHAEGCPIEILTETLTLEDVSLECLGRLRSVEFVRGVNVVIPAQFITGDGSASTIDFTVQSVNPQVGGEQETLTVGDDVDLDVAVVAGPYTLLFDENLCPGVTLTFDVDDGTCLTYEECPADTLTFEVSDIVTPSEGVCRGDGTAVLIPEGAVGEVSPIGATYQYTITQGAISVDSPAAWTLADEISVDLVPNVEATFTVFFSYLSVFECTVEFAFTPACEPETLCGTDFECDGELIDKDDKENQVCATSTCDEADCCDAPNCATEVTCNPKSAKPFNTGAPCSGGLCNRGQCCVEEPTEGDGENGANGGGG